MMLTPHVLEKLTGIVAMSKQPEPNAVLMAQPTQHKINVPAARIS